MKPETAGKIKFTSWGLIGGAVIAMIVGFGWGGWTTAGTTQKMSQQAVVNSQAGICVAQLMNEPDHKAILAEYGKLDEWKRPDFITKGGWDKMPGQEKADYGVAQACCEGLNLLVKK